MTRLSGSPAPAPSQPLQLMLLVVPLTSLAAFKIWGEIGLIAVAAVMPVLVLGLRLKGRNPRVAPPVARDTGTRQDFLTLLTPLSMPRDGLDLARATSACFVMEIDDFARMQDRFGHQQADLIAERIGARLRAMLRPGDMMLQVGDGRYCFALNPGPQVDLETCINIAGRIQTTVEKLIRTEQLTLHATASIGFCQLNRNPGETAASWLEAAEVALVEAQLQGVSGLRGFTRDLAQKSQIQLRLRKSAARALDDGEITAWFQPQISTDTGDVSGFEALARWHHPELGVLGPGQFLPALREANLLDRLSDVMLAQAIEAMARWDTAGLNVPQIGGNFTEDDLRDPNLPERVAWRLEQAGLPTDRLAVEILESVVTDSQDESVIGCVTRLSEMGCRIDMDDFGTGNASVSAIRRLNVSRIKIDRSLVRAVDRDPEQQRVIAAVLTMTDKLGIDTLGEGAETPGEHAMLAQLGCRHVQGYGIALPMPMDETLTWISNHRARLVPAPTVGHRS